MKLDPRSLLAPLIGVVVLVFLIQTTLSALRASGMWEPTRHSLQHQENPYSELDGVLAHPDTVRALAVADRDPFSFGPAPSPVAVRASTPHRAAAKPLGPTTPAPPPPPTLTSIIWDQDPRATVRYEGKDISIRENSLFADFTVKSISQNEVVLERNGEQVVLRLARKGD